MLILVPQFISLLNLNLISILVFVNSFARSHLSARVKFPGPKREDWNVDSLSLSNQIRSKFEQNLHLAYSTSLGGGFG